MRLFYTKILESSFSVLSFFKVAILGFSSLLVLPAMADQFNQKPILVGDKGAALGGAYTGLADDATATYYNPAGMLLIKNAKLNVSAQLAQFQKQDIAISSTKSLPYNSFNFTPSITSFGQKVGTNWAYGFSIVTPQNDLFQGEQEQKAEYSDPDSPFCSDPSVAKPCLARQRLNYSELNKSNLIGPSLAMQWNERLALGVSLFGIYSSQLEKTAFGGSNEHNVQGEVRARFEETLVWRDVSQTGFGLTGIFGALIRFDALTMGVRVSPGSVVRITRLEEQRFENYTNQALVKPGTSRRVPTTATLYTVEKDVHHYEIAAPSSSWGWSWKPIPRLVLVGQVDYLLGAEYEYTGFSPDQQDTALVRSGFDELLAIQKTYTIEKKPVLNFSGGLDFSFNDTYSTAFGAYTDFSQGPYDNRESSWNRRIDWYGAALSLGIVKQYTESRFGVYGAYGSAEITHFQWEVNENGKPEIATDANGIKRPRQAFSSWSLGLILSSTLKI